MYEKTRVRICIFVLDMHLSVQENDCKKYICILDLYELYTKKIVKSYNYILDMCGLYEKKKGKSFNYILGICLSVGIPRQDKTRVPFSTCTVVRRVGLMVLV